MSIVLYYFHYTFQMRRGIYIRKENPLNLLPPLWEDHSAAEVGPGVAKFGTTHNLIEGRGTKENYFMSD